MRVRRLRQLNLYVACRYEVVLDSSMKAWSEISEHNGVGCVRLREV